MKKALLLACLFLLSTSLSWACIPMGPDQGSYEVRDGQVFYKSSGKPYDRNNFVLVEGADAASLTYLDGKFSSTHEELTWYFNDYVLDKNHVYYQGRVLEGINPAQAIFLRQHLTRLS